MSKITSHTMIGVNIVPASKLQPLEVPHMLWIDITADFTINLPLSNSFNSILVVVNHFSKKVEFIPCNKTIVTIQQPTQEVQPPKLIAKLCTWKRSNG